MSYVNRNLLPGESLIYRAHLHWLIYARALCILIVAVGLMIYFRGERAHLGFIAGVLLAAMGGYYWMKAFIDAWTTELAVTSMRVIVKTGLIRRNSLELRHTKVESVGVQQSILGRILNFGAVVVHGTGGGTQVIKQIKAPVTFTQYASRGSDNV